MSIWHLALCRSVCMDVNVTCWVKRFEWSENYKGALQVVHLLFTQRPRDSCMLCAASHSWSPQIKMIITRAKLSSMWELRLVSNTVGAIDQITARRQEACRLGRKQGKQNVTVLNKNYACRHCTAHVQVSTYFLSSSGFYKCVCYLIIYVFWKVAEMERTCLCVPV